MFWLTIIILFSLLAYNLVAWVVTDHYDDSAPLIRYEDSDAYES